MLKNVAKILTQIDEGSLTNFAQILLNSKSHRIWLAGNGGSGATASHFASDLANLGFDTVCLTDNVPRLTALTNDYGWIASYDRQLSHFKKGDVFIAISVHGSSQEWSNNLFEAATVAEVQDGKILSLVGYDGGQLAKISDFSIIVPSDQTYIIEGIHSVLAHAICEKIRERELTESMKAQFIGDEQCSK